MGIDNVGVSFHKPVLIDEVVKYLDIQSGEKYIDATVGGGGHTAAILKAGGEVLGIDRNPAAVKFAEERLAAEFPSLSFSCHSSSRDLGTKNLRGSKNLRDGVPRRSAPQNDGERRAPVIAQGNFKNIDSVAKAHGFKNVSGILFDLGMSSWQIENSRKGFSFLKNEPLDMRMGPSQSVRAEDLLAALAEKELNGLFSKFAQEKRSRTIARAIVCARRLRRIRSTQELAGLLAWVEIYPPKFRRNFGGGDFWGWYEGTFSKDPARFGSYDRRARIFQALRIVVNGELNNLEEALPRALQLLNGGGRLVAISFHSLEDRVVKRFGKTASEVCVLTKKPVYPSEDEVRENPRARSAKLRAFEKVS